MKFKLFPILIVFAIISSCSKDDETPIFIEPNIDPIGSYLLTGFNTTIPTDLNFDGKTSTNQILETDCYDYFILTIKSDGTFVNNNKLAIKNPVTNSLSCSQGSDIYGTYTVSGKTVTLKYLLNGVEKTLNLKSNSSQILTSDVSRIEIANSFQNQIISISSDVEYVFTKK